MVANILRKRVLASFLLLFFSSPLAAEVEWVRITWTAQLCERGCQQNVEKNLSKIKGVTQVEIDGPGGVATLRWDPRHRFSYMPIDYAMRMVGPSIREIRVKVRGTINHHGKVFNIVSTGDNSSFELLAVPIPLMKNDTVANNSLYTRELEPAMRSQLENAEKAVKTVSIEGPLFEPWRSPALRIAVQNITVNDNKAENSKNSS